MKVEAMVRRLPVAWPNRRPITRTSTPWARRKPDTVNAVPVPAQSEPAPLTQWYKDRSMGLGRPLGVVKCEAVWTVHGTHPTKGDKTITVNAKHPREAHAKAKAALKASGHKVTSVKFKEAVIEGGPGSGRHPDELGRAGKAADKSRMGAIRAHLQQMKMHMQAARSAPNKFVQRAHMQQAYAHSTQARAGMGRFGIHPSNTLQRTSMGLYKKVYGEAKKKIKPADIPYKGSTMPVDTAGATGEVAIDSLGIKAALAAIFKQAEGGPGSGRHPGFGAKMYDAAAKAVAARQAATAQRRAGYAARAKNIAAKNVAAKKAGDSLMAQHLARMARQTVYGPKVFGYRGAQGFKVESLNEAKKKLKADPKTLGISTFQVGGQTYEAAPSTSYYRSAGKALLQRKLTADEQSDIKKLKGVYKKLKVEGGAGSGNFEHGGRLHKQGFSRVGGGTKVAPDPQAKKDFHLAAAKDKWYHRNE